jgi:two-component system chemotaxis response regulator CheY
VKANNKEREMAFNILIVDDSATMRGMVKKVLGMTELPLGELWEAANGREGLEKMRSNWVDLVLADLNMPDMTGQEMIDEMKRDGLLASLPVVVVSSEGDKAVLDHLAQKGVQEIVRKPFEATLLRQVIEKALGANA